MTNTSAYPFTVDGTRLDTLAYNVMEVAIRGVPGVRSADEVVPGRHGVIAALNEDYEAPERVLTMMVRGYDVDGLNGSRATFDANLDTLFRLFAVRHRLLDFRWTVGDGSIRQAYAKVSSAIAPKVDGIGYTGEFMVGFTIPDVFDQDVNTQDWGVAGVVSGAQHTVPFLTGDTAPIEDAIFVLEGPTTNPVITDVETGATLTLGTNLAAGERARIDCGTWSATKGSTVNCDLSTPGPTNIVAGVAYTGSGARFLSLRPNASKEIKVSLTGTGHTASTILSLRARRKFL